ncbi:hypothetical protein [Halosimplex marinum]|uniref:hypothetical protein n=1 Tax=Halosimplex marinum TaxID=3396620 RepID=UPI003F54D819
MRRKFEGTDRGKRVVADDGSAVGTIVRTNGDRARVLLDPSRSGQSDPTAESGSRTTVTIDRRRVAESTNDRVRLVEDADPTEARGRA